MKVRWRQGFDSQKGQVSYSLVHPAKAQPDSYSADTLAGFKSKLIIDHFLRLGLCLALSHRVWLEFLTTVKIFILVFFVIKTCGSVGWCQHFGETYFLHFQGMTQFLEPRKCDCLIYWTPSSICVCSMRVTPSDRMTVMDQLQLSFSVRKLVILKEGLAFFLILGRQILG
jgi:hypothetical protein